LTPGFNFRPRGFASGSSTCSKSSRHFSIYAAQFSLSHSHPTHTISSPFFTSCIASQKHAHEKIGLLKCNYSRTLHFGWWKLVENYSGALARLAVTHPRQPTTKLIGGEINPWLQRKKLQRKKARRRSSSA
jgi:hypothetical protein